MTESIDPALVPKRKLYTGAEMPVVGLGTFGSDHVTAAQIAEITSGETGILEYIRNGEKRFLAYTPVGKGDYISIIILPNFHKVIIDHPQSI